MQANVGDQIVIPGRRVGQPVRDCLVLEVRGADGEGPYLVRWSDNGHEGVFWPSNDAQIRQLGHHEDTPG